jgi:hypothetical protein
MPDDMDIVECLATDEPPHAGDERLDVRGLRCQPGLRGRHRPASRAPKSVAERDAGCGFEYIESHADGDHRRGARRILERSWTNTTFGSTGPAAATITADRGPLAAPPSQGGSASRRPCPRTQSSSSGTGAALAAGALARTPSGRLATLDDVADVALFLCSPFADQIVGQTLVLDGGASLLA